MSASISTFKIDPFDKGDPIEMRPFRKGDVFYGDRSGRFAEVTWVDPRNEHRAHVTLTKDGEIERIEEEGFASQFQTGWTLFRMGPAPASSASR